MSKSIYLGAYILVFVAAIYLNAVFLGPSCDNTKKKSNNDFKQLVEEINREARVTEKQIVVEAGATIYSMTVIYKGNKPPVLVEEEEFSSTGLQLKVISPQEVRHFITTK